MPTIRAAAVLAAFLVLTFVLIPWQWLLLKLGGSARRTFPASLSPGRGAAFRHQDPRGGNPPRGAALPLANHSSWLDIVIFSAVTPLSFIAKSEVNGWPFFGTLARLQRTVFVSRARRSETGEARDAIARAAGGGRCAGAVSRRHLE